MRGRRVRNLRSRSLIKSRSSRRVRRSRKSTRSKRSSKSRRHVSRKMRGGLLRWMFDIDFVNNSDDGELVDLIKKYILRQEGGDELPGWGVVKLPFLTANFLSQKNMRAPPLVVVSTPLLSSSFHTN